MPVEIHGTCAPEFSAIKDAFAENLDSGLEIGCSVAVTQGEEYAVDLWAGYKDEAGTQPWDEDTVVMVASCTKIPVALCGLMLIDQGLVQPDDPVMKYWPEFGQNGKEKVTFRHLMTHMSGVAGTSLPAPTVFDWNVITSHLAAQAPRWEPGTQWGYHALTFGFLIGEVIRRVTGKMPGVYLEEEVCTKIGADFHIGFPESELGRMARLINIDLAPDMEDLPTVPMHPERVVGKWYAPLPTEEISGSVLCLELSVEDDILRAVVTSGWVRPPVEDVRFNGKTLRIKWSTYGGLFCLDCELERPDTLDATLYAGGEEFDATFGRQEIALASGNSAIDKALMIKEAFPVARPQLWRDSRWYTSEIPGGNGIGNARSLARIGAVLANGGTLAGHTFLSLETLELALTEQSYRECIILGWLVRFGFGFALNSAEFPCPGDRSLQWGGAGGSQCVMDLDSKTSFAYVMNGMLASRLMGPRIRGLLAAHYKSLGKPTDIDSPLS